MAQTLFKAENLALQMSGKWLWKELSFELYSGDKMVLFGQSGTGKTLLLKTLASLIPLQIGQIFFQKKPLNSFYLPLYRSQIIYFQQTPSFTEGSVLENLKNVFKYRVHESKEFQLDKIKSFLEQMNRPLHFLEKDINYLSGGEQQIVALIRGLQLDPSILLLDEPTASLDDETSRQIENLIKHWIGSQSERAFIWVTHDSNQKNRLANRELSL